MKLQETQNKKNATAAIMINPISIHCLWFWSRRHDSLLFFYFILFNTEFFCSLTWTPLHISIFLTLLPLSTTILMPCLHIPLTPITTSVLSVRRSNPVRFLDLDPLQPQPQPQPVGTGVSFLCNRNEPYTTGWYRFGPITATDCNRSSTQPVQTGCYWSYQ
jgi:hypothetical protein